MLKLYEPQTFLFIENYVGTLSSARAGGGVALATCAAVLLCLGLPFRRLSAAMLLGGVAWAGGGIVAMQTHLSFALWSIAFASVGAVLGLLLPRFAHALYAAVVAGLLARLGGLFVDPEFALYALAGGAAIGFLFVIAAWHSGPALMSAATGAFMLGFLLQLPTTLAHDDELILRISLAVALMIFGLWLQFRIDEITFGRAKDRWQRMSKRFRKK